MSLILCHALIFSVFISTSDYLNYQTLLVLPFPLSHHHIFLCLRCSIWFFMFKITLKTEQFDYSNNRIIKVMSQPRPRLLVFKLSIVASLLISVSRFISIITTKLQNSVFLSDNLENIIYIFKRFIEEKLCSASDYAILF